jgi:hypothetical protein
MTYNNPQKLKVICPVCGHEQIITLETSIVSDGLAGLNKIFNGVETMAVNGAFECICGRFIDAVLLVIAKK